MNDDLTTRLSRQLHEQVDDWHTTPLTFESVRGRAHAIRRTRRIAVAGVAAVAVAAVAVPTALLGDPASRSDRSSEIAETPTEATEPPLGVPYLTGRELVLPDGTGRDLPERYQGGAVLGETFLGLRTDDTGFLVLDELDAEDDIVDSVVLDTGLTQNLDGSAIAYVTDGELVVRWEDGEAGFGSFGPVSPVRLVGGPVCTEGESTCTVYFNDERGDPAVAVNHGAVNGVAGDPRTVTDVAEDGRISMITRVSELPEPGACSAVYDQSAGEQLHGTCDYTFGRFSPDGSLLSATHPYRDGFGDAWRAILDAATGEELARYEPPSGAITSSVWEDDGHLLITSWEEGRWKVTRLGVDGSTEVVLGPARAGQQNPAYAILGASS
jgi:hypothetical protein